MPGRIVRFTRSLTALLLAALVIACARDGQLSLSGNLETDDHDLVSPITAQILAIRVKEGQKVAFGDTVAILDTISVAAAYRAAQAAEAEAQARVSDLEFGSDREKIRAARAQVEIASANLAQAERDWARNDSLFLRGLIDARTREQSTLARDNARSGLETARQNLADLERGARTYQLEGARASLDRAAQDRTARQRDFDRLILVATRNGVIQFLPYQAGEYVPAGRPVATINDPDELWAKVYVPEERLKEVAIGQQVRFRVYAAPGRNFTATVAFIASEAEFTPRNVQTPDERINLVFAVKLIVAPGQEGLRPGMPADFYFE
jgi:HlyD family secretion protein